MSDQDTGVTWDERRHQQVANALESRGDGLLQDYRTFAAALFRAGLEWGTHPAGRADRIERLMVTWHKPGDDGWLMNAALALAGRVGAQLVINAADDERDGALVRRQADAVIHALWPPDGEETDAATLTAACLELGRALGRAPHLPPHLRTPLATLARAANADADRRSVLGRLCQNAATMALARGWPLTAHGPLADAWDSVLADLGEPQSGPSQQHTAEEQEEDTERDGARTQVLAWTKHADFAGGQEALELLMLVAVREEDTQDPVDGPRSRAVRDAIASISRRNRIFRTEAAVVFAAHAAALYIAMAAEEPAATTSGAGLGDLVRNLAALAWPSQEPVLYREIDRTLALVRSCEELRRTAKLLPHRSTTLVRDVAAFASAEPRAVHRRLVMDVAREAPRARQVHTILAAATDQAAAVHAP